jgi:hypothetical protein
MHSAMDLAILLPFSVINFYFATSTLKSSNGEAPTLWKLIGEATLLRDSSSSCIKLN